MEASRDLESISKKLFNNYPKEGCGAWIKNYGFLLCRNESSENDTFVMNSEDWIIAQLIGKPSLIFHSHPSGSVYPSEYDKIMAKHFNLPFIILSRKDLGIYIP